MAIDPGSGFIIISALGAIPGVVALFNSRNARKEVTARIDAEAFKAARDFYSNTLDEYKEELAETRKALREARLELKDAKTEREFLAMRVAMLERDNQALEAAIAGLEANLKKFTSSEDKPNPQEGSQ